MTGLGGRLSQCDVPSRRHSHSDHRCRPRSTRGGCPGLSNGVRVRVDGLRQPDGSVLATEVEVDEDDPGLPDPPDPDDEPGPGDDDAPHDDGQVRVEGVVRGLGGACRT